MRFLNADSSHTISSNESSPLPSTEEESKDFTKGKIMPAVLDRKGEDKELFLHLLTLNCLQLKIILMLKWFLLGGRILIPCMAKIRSLGIIFPKLLWVSFPSFFLSLNPSSDPIYLTSGGAHNLPGPSVQFSRSVVSDSLPPHESQHARPPCPSPTPGVHPDSRPLSQ